MAPPGGWCLRASAVLGLGVFPTLTRAGAVNSRFQKPIITGDHSE